MSTHYTFVSFKSSAPSRRIFFGLLIAFLGIGAASAQAPVPVGEDFQVNQYTTETQAKPRIASDAQGDFVVVWESEGSSGDDSLGFSIQMLRFLGDPISLKASPSEFPPLDPELQVNVFTTGDQRAPDAAMTPGGDLAVVWQSSAANDDDGEGIRLRLFASDGTPSAPFRVNSYTTGDQLDPSIARSDSGDFVVVWESFGPAEDDASGSGVRAQRYASDGTPIGEAFQVNQTTTGDQHNPSVVMAPQGEFVVAWQGDDASAAGYDGVLARRYQSDGRPLGDEFVVNTYEPSLYCCASRNPAVDTDQEGNFVVVWDSFQTSNNAVTVDARLFDADGNALTDDFQVNEFTTETHREPSVSMTPYGDFFIVWETTAFDPNRLVDDVAGRRFRADGTPAHNTMVINSNTEFFQSDADVVFGPDGNLVAVWQTFDSGQADQEAVNARRLTTQIFTDGFASGDTSAWSPEKR